MEDPDKAIIVQRHGPTGDTYNEDTVPQSDFYARHTDPDSPADQCVFICGYKTTRRSILPGFKIAAAA